MLQHKPGWRQGVTRSHPLTLEGRTWEHRQQLILLLWGLELLQSQLLALLMWELETAVFPPQSTRGIWKNPSSPQGWSKAFSSGTQPNPLGSPESHPLYLPSSHEA